MHFFFPQIDRRAAGDGGLDCHNSDLNAALVGPNAETSVRINPTAKDSGGGMNLQTATQMAAVIVMTAALGMKVRTVTIQSQKKARRTKKESTR